MQDLNIEEEITEFDWRPYVIGEDIENDNENILAHSKRGAKKIPE